MTELVGLIGGSSLLHSSLLSTATPQAVPTSHGPVVVHRSPGVVFVQRHKCVGVCVFARSSAREGAPDRTREDQAYEVGPAQKAFPFLTPPAAARCAPRGHRRGPPLARCARGGGSGIGGRVAPARVAGSAGRALGLLQPVGDGVGAER